MTTYAAPHAYRDGAVLTASPAKLVVLLYDGAIRFLRQAAVAMQSGDAAQASARMQRAEAIISELQVTLDHQKGGEVAARLEAIYLFWRRHLDAARIEQDPRKVLQVARQASELREAFAAAAAGA